MNIWEFLLSLGFWQWIGLIILANAVLHGAAIIILNILAFIITLFRKE